MDWCDLYDFYEAFVVFTFLIRSLKSSLGGFESLLLVGWTGGDGASGAGGAIEWIGAFYNFTICYDGVPEGGDYGAVFAFVNYIAGDIDVAEGAVGVRRTYRAEGADMVNSAYCIC